MKTCNHLQNAEPQSQVECFIMWWCILCITVVYFFFFDLVKLPLRSFLKKHIILYVNYENRAHRSVIIKTKQLSFFFILLKIYHIQKTFWNELIRIILKKKYKPKLHKSQKIVIHTSDSIEWLKSYFQIKPKKKKTKQQI